MRKVIHWIVDETKRILPAVIYFAIAFNLIHFTEGLAFGPNDIRYFNYLGVTLSAVLVGKALIIINIFPFVDLFSDKPLIYNITWKFFIYNIFIFLFRILEEIINLYFRYDSFAMAMEHEKIRLTAPFFWSIEVMFMLVFFVYIVFSEFTRALGKDRVMKMLFG